MVFKSVNVVSIHSPGSKLKILAPQNPSGISLAFLTIAGADLTLGFGMMDFYNVLMVLLTLTDSLVYGPLTEKQVKIEEFSLFH